MNTNPSAANRPVHFILTPDEFKARGYEVPRPLGLPKKAFIKIVAATGQIVGSADTKEALQ